MSDLLELSAIEIATLIARREIRSRDVVTAALQAINADAGYRAFLAVVEETALLAARAADERADAGTGGPLNGVPIAIKDLCETADLATTYGLASRREHRPATDCVMVERLRAAGAVIVGKTNTPALGLLGETKNLLGADTVHPLDPSLSPGGSSGGSAVAVARRMVPLASGTDSAGSITAPAGFCGVVGIRPSHGRIPNWPAGPGCGLLNDLGPLSRNVGDAALFLQVAAGPDARDPVSRTDEPPDFRGAVDAAAATGTLDGLRIAFTPDLGHFAVDPQVRAVCEAAAHRFAALGARVDSAQPTIGDPFEIYMPLCAADSRLAIRDLAAADELYPETIEELASWPDTSAAAYTANLWRLWQLRATVGQFFEQYPVMIMPATAVPAFPLGKMPATIGGRSVAPSWTSSAPFSALWNMTGQPTMSVPAGTTSNGLPIGLLIVGRVGGEVDVLRAAAAFEAAQGAEPRR